MKKTIFKDCSLHEADFVEADLSKSVFDNCDFAGTSFERTNLAGADFRTSFNYNFDPELNHIKNAKFSLTGIAGLLSKYNIQID